MNHHIIFEGAELSGKSWIMSQIYNHLEPKYNESGKILDGCHWFNCDVGVFGTKYGKDVVNDYLKIFKTLSNKNLIVEKLHIADKIYNKIHRNKNTDYEDVEDVLQKLDFKIVLITFPEDVEIIKNRIKDRLNIYPHYERVLQKPEWYISQQREYLSEIKKSKLSYLIVETNHLPDETKVSEILEWIDEK